MMHLAYTNFTLSSFITISKGSKREKQKAVVYLSICSITKCLSSCHFLCKICFYWFQGKTLIVIELLTVHSCLAILEANLWVSVFSYKFSSLLF